MTKQATVTILAIETSCDETAAAVIQNGSTILSNVVYSQMKSHQRFGGVVPEIASRHHVENVTLVLEAALDESGCSWDQIDAIAVTEGPGLVGALLIGIQAAKALAFIHKKPLIGVHHIAGHIYANRLEDELEYPLLSLVVSGGHTELIYMEGPGQFEKLGETRDDAAGEAFDKVARLLKLPYPGGPHIDRLAQKGKVTYKFPKALADEDTYDFSFSGVKSAVMNVVHNAQQRGETIVPEDIARSFQQSVVDVLIERTMKAVKQYKVNQVVVAGGVAANRGLRQALEEAFRDLETPLAIPPLKYCTDNAAMIGAAAYEYYVAGQFRSLDMNAQPGLRLVSV
ncbi:tRNA (adenosine(37)-N6)-threonylcarbamoyltransferase complex transferase subunit TsaD [Bacillus fonticola]|uniref:tRNA (adenosine(37)-N6)-threonylcarbamoyltransferase complex transferase subunit TsaD n=1 Tax=Bacillus fonticola TaxID=2728853 RepID=UPI00147434E4|nr:tRNA (adenosine(37)-N6)-threonylcarbamoyltransferase complex transferase subunit TsaD [Bacillus fonticola]